MLVRAFVPSRWSRHPNRVATTLKRFSDVEADSAWQYLRALDVCRDTSARRMLFENVLEEFKHADYFSGAAHQLATERLRSSTQGRTLLASSAADVPAFLAYAHVCEEAIHTQFDSYAQACNIPEVSTVFRDISDDEASHGNETLEYLRRLAGGDAQARRAILAARLRRAYEAWMRLSARMGTLTFYPLLVALFFAFGPLLRSPASDAKMSSEGRRGSGHGSTGPSDTTTALG